MYHPHPTSTHPFPCMSRGTSTPKGYIYIYIFIHTVIYVCMWKRRACGMHGTIILIGLESKEASFHIRSMFWCKWGSIKVVLVAKCSPTDITWGVLERPVPTIDPTSTMWDIGSPHGGFFFCNIFERCVTVGWAQHVRNLKTKFPFRKWPSVLGDPENRLETGGNLRFRRNGHQSWVVFLLKNLKPFIRKLGNLMNSYE